METLNQQTNMPDKTSFTKQRKIAIVFAIILAVLLVAAIGVYWFVNKNATNNTTTNVSNTNIVNNVVANTTNTANNSSTNSTTQNNTTTDTQTYTNSAYKFSLVYPKTYQDYGTCDDVKKVRDAIDANQARPQISNVALKLFEVPGENKVYLAPEKTIEIKMYSNDGSTYYFDYSSCKVVTTTLDVINHWNDSLNDVTVLRPTMLEMPFGVRYDTMNNDQDFITFFDKDNNLIKTGCTVNKTLVNNETNIYKVSIGGGEACYAEGGAPTIFQYSSASKTAVLTSGFQILPFGLEDSFIHFTK